MMTAAMAILAAGCAKEIDSVNPAGEDVVFEASLSETEADAKAVLIPGKAASKVEWVKGDLVGVYAGTSYYEYKADKSGVSSTLSPVGASSLAAEYYAVYPYDAAATLAGGVITTTLPSEQNSSFGSFSHHLAVAHSELRTLNFKNVCGLFAADVTEPGVTKIEIKGNNNEILAGKIAITVADTPSWTAVEGVKTVSISAPQGKTLQLGTYYMAVLPQEFAAGVTVTAYYKDGTSYAKNVTDKFIVAASGLVGGKIASGEWKVETLLTELGDSPQDIVPDSDGNFWVTRRKEAHGIYKYTLADNKYTLLSKTSDLLTNSHPWGADVHDGTLYFAAKAVGKVLKCDAQGNITQFPVNDQTLSNPMKVLVDDSGNVYVLCRAATSKIYKVKDDGSVLATYTLPTAGSYGFEFMCFNADKSRIFTFPSDAGRIMQIDLTSGEIVKVAGTGVNHNKNTYTDGTPGNPMTATLGQCDGAVCGADGTIYFSEGASGKTIRMFVPDSNGDYSKGTIRTIYGTPYSTTPLAYPNGLALGTDGKTLYYTENAGKICKLTYVKNE